VMPGYLDPAKRPAQAEIIKPIYRRRDAISTMQVRA
jgi:hypothetical protein